MAITRDTAVIQYNALPSRGDCRYDASGRWGHQIRLGLIYYARDYLGLAGRCLAPDFSIDLVVPCEAGELGHA
jgi:hypothetical protein